MSTIEDIFYSLILVTSFEVELIQWPDKKDHQLYEKSALSRQQSSFDKEKAIYLVSDSLA